MGQSRKLPYQVEPDTQVPRNESVVVPSAMVRLVNLPLPLNEFSPMELTVLGIVRLVSPQLRKAFSLIEIRLAGIAMLVKLLHSEKAYPPTDVTTGKVMFDKLLQLAKAYSPIEVTSGNAMLVKPLQPKKA